MKVEDIETSSEATCGDFFTKSKPSRCEKSGFTKNQSNFKGTMKQKHCPIFTAQTHNNALLLLLLQNHKSLLKAYMVILKHFKQQSTGHEQYSHAKSQTMTGSDGQ